MNKLTVAFVKEHLTKYQQEEISMSRFVEILNEKSQEPQGFSFSWASGLTEFPDSGEVVVAQKKDFSFEKIKYNRQKQRWFQENVACWLKVTLP